MYRSVSIFTATLVMPHLQNHHSIPLSSDLKFGMSAPNCRKGWKREQYEYKYGGLE